MHRRRPEEDIWTDPEHPNTRGTPRRRTLVAFSAYHMSMAVSLAKAIYEHRLITFPPFHLPIAGYTPTKMTEFLRRGNSQDLMTFPARLEGAVKDATYADQLRKLERIACGGGKTCLSFSFVILARV